MRCVNSLKFGLFLSLWIAMAGYDCLWSQPFRITEFMADNGETIVDDDGDRSDWIEIQNNSGSSASLEGWSLTESVDDLAQWTFPAVTLLPGEHRVVFASGRDRAELGRPLHANFELNRDGEYLALVDPDGNVATEFSPAFPSQQADISYGIGSAPGTETVLLSPGAAARALIPNDDSLAMNWIDPAFDDSDWRTGSTGVGYDYGGLIGLDVGDMRNFNETVYVRIPFELDELPELDRLILRMQYEDGMAAYLNGIQVASDNAPSTLIWNSGAPSNRSDSIAVDFAEFDLTAHIDLLRLGKNVLAIHGLNNQTTSSDLLIRPELAGVDLPEGSFGFGYCFTPTPGLENAMAAPGLLGGTDFSEPSGTFRNPMTVALSPTDAISDGAEIRFTLDGSAPNLESILYEDPLTLTETTQIRARLTHPDGAMGPVESRHYIALDSEVESFSSNLPLVLLDNFDQGAVSQNQSQSAFMAIFEPTDGRSGLTGTPTLTTRIGMKVRGSSTSGRPKPSLTIEARNENDGDKNIAPLGMPSESDWVLWGPYNFDRALMRNPLIYELSNQVGRYAVRTRFVEVFLNINGRAISDSHYWGVYALMEKIDRDEDRVDVEKLFPDHDREPWVSGGYIFKIDRPDPGDSGFSEAGQSIRYVEPKEVEIESPERQAQEDFAHDYFDAFGRALNGPNFTDPDEGYAKHIDVEAAIDHHLLNVLAFNVDALRLSTYFHKPRGGKIVFGPIWDFDRAMGSTDGRDDNPRVWRAQTGDRGTDFFNYPWWGRMFSDIDFFQRYIDRWQELRRGPFHVDNIHFLIDSMADQLREAQARDLARWGQSPRFGGYQGEINHIKDWFSERVDFMESQFVAPPILKPNGGMIEPGLNLNMTSPEGGAVYYTLDGTDPRSPVGGVSGSASEFTQHVAIDERTWVTARSRNLNHQSLTGADNPPLSSPWSGPVRVLFSNGDPASSSSLIVTELHFNPADPNEQELQAIPGANNDDFEFIELMNVSDSPIELAGVRFVDGIEFDFTDSSIQILEPGGRVVVAKQIAAIQARHGQIDNLAGEYIGNLDNNGESIRMVGANGEAILAFEYRDDWFPLADGGGHSLVVREEAANSGNLSEKSGWREGGAFGGTPGEEETNGGVDTDGDGLPDDWELAQGLDPDDGEGDQGADGDPDGDGRSNREEYISGTNPLDAGSVLKVESVERQEGTTRIRFIAAPGKAYSILYRPQAESGDWETLQDVPPSETREEIVVLDDNPANKRFYRLTTPPTQ